MSVHPSFRCLRVLVLTCAMAAPATCSMAYEVENSVPLTITAALGAVTVGRTEVGLAGHAVAITTELHNDTQIAQAVTFYAQPPLFNAAGIGEEYFDKTFADLRVDVGGRPQPTRISKRAFFMGEDITGQLVKVGLSPLPDTDADHKKLARLPRRRGAQVDNWQGLVIHAWSYVVPSLQNAVSHIRYRSLPEFGYEDVNTDRFELIVRQHCGDPALVKRRVKEVDPKSAYVLVERHTIPLSFSLMNDVKVEITQPSGSPIRGRPVLSLACGLPNPHGTTAINGIIRGGIHSLGVLVVSALTPLPDASAADLEESVHVVD